MKPRRGSSLDLFATSLFATLVEGAALYWWLRLHQDGHPWWGLASLTAGEVVETAFLVAGTGKAGLGRWDQLKPAELAHHRKLNRINSVAGTLEVGIWVLWLALFNWLDSVPAPQQIIAAGVVLLVLIHLKHRVETAAIRDTPFRTDLFAPRGVFGTVMEVGGAMACLALIEDHQYVLAAVALGAGLLIEHLSLLDELRWEVGARDIRRPRDRRWKPPRRRKAMLYVTTRFPSVWKRVERIEWLARRFNRFAINRAISFVEPRPNPVSTMADYTSWSSLTDRSYSGRHLPPAASLATANGLKKPPDVNTVAELFKREGAMVECPKSTVLFSWFAQWFTDGFLRTSREFGRDGVRNTLKNESTHEIDLAQLYGRTDKQRDQLRAHDGLLRSQTINGEEYPKYLCALGDPKPEFSELPKPVGFDALRKHQQDRLFAMGSDVTNFGVVAFNVLFLREHNRIARRLGAENPKWDDERVFQTARAVLIVVQLKIVIEEYIHHISPAHFRPRLAPASFPNESWNRPNRMAIEFNLLYRWHSLVPSTFLLNGTDFQIDDVLFDTNRLTSKGLGPFMAAASGQPAGRIGLFNTDPWFIKRVEVPSIEQARKVDLCSYNDYRRLCRYPPVRSWEEISSDEGKRQRLSDVYGGDVDNVEFYVGLFAEDPHPNGVLPPLMATMVAFDAFSQALTNPLLAPRIYKEETFSPAGWKIVKEPGRLSDLVKRNVPSGFEDFVSLTRRDFERI